MSTNETSGTAVGVTMFASVLLMIAGMFQFLVGFASVINDQTFVVTAEYIYKLNTTTWGLIHIAIGVVLFFAGIFLLQGAVWARALVVVIAAVSAVANFVWIPYQPWWSLIVILFDVMVIWAVTAHGRDIERA
ncbi:MAG: hypothetical protein OEW41_06655 [Actinomycetota bacterium]|nr:hypothetical protein [Actinomycetota bacterium]